MLIHLLPYTIIIFIKVIKAITLNTKLNHLHVLNFNLTSKNNFNLANLVNNLNDVITSFEVINSLIKLIIKLNNYDKQFINNL